MGPGNGLPEHLIELAERSTEGMSEDNCKQVFILLKKHSKVFSKSEEDLGRTGIVRHKISTENTSPIKQRLRRVPTHLSKEVDDQIHKMLEKDVIEPLSSPWASEIVLVQKKDDSRRFCVDYRKLNDVTVKDAYLYQGSMIAWINGWIQMVFYFRPKFGILASRRSILLIAIKQHL